MFLLTLLTNWKWDTLNLDLLYDFRYKIEIPFIKIFHIWKCFILKNRSQFQIGILKWRNGNSGGRYKYVSIGESPTPGHVFIPTTPYCFSSYIIPYRPSDYQDFGEMEILISLNFNHSDMYLYAG